ncbi:MAG: 2-oxoglutarate dehydrogenase E1 component [Chitinophagales bacterium]|nr:2-oxoglutarate dehydrogenase E1 component [Bacteroidota bacterium]MCB9042323.1 2-oxoglutarate dehydrogenase E1 component [Chitinophagales bacterium]
MNNPSYISNANPAYIEDLYKTYLQQPQALDEGWKRFFEGFDFALQSGNGKVDATATTPAIDANLSKEISVYALIYTYRKNAHLISDTNPIRKRKDRKARVSLEDFGLTQDDLNTHFEVGNYLGLGNATLGEIIDFLQRAYCKKIGVEYAYINDPEKRHWIREKFEQAPEDFGFDMETKKRILSKLNDASIFEKFLGTKYLGEKRFSLEGGESTIPALDAIINYGAELGVQEFTMGMAHRGRLNVLANILKKTYRSIFNEFEGSLPNDLTMGDGDVKYHLGYSSILHTTSGRDVHVKLVPNPSHLEAVDSVLLGFTRAKADLIYNSNYDDILPILLHGDAAIAGQGIMYEITQMSKLKGYLTGGTIHFVINNQIGFTTDFDDARSSNYATSLAAAIEAPVFHVNGDDVEAVVYVAKVATEYRQKFNSDVYIDMVCYRRHGHNEGDDPKFTQPKMYDIISEHANPRDLYIQKLTQRGEVEAELAKQMDESFWAELQNRLDETRQNPLQYQYQEPEIAWRKLRRSQPEDFEKSPVTAVSAEEIQYLIKAIDKMPEGFKPLRKVARMLQQNLENTLHKKQIDWATAELLAYASLLVEGKNVRMSGQDVKRGTFSHRHAVITDEETNIEYNRLSDLSPTQGRFMIYNSLLSEFAVLGFEYGYAMASPDHLVLWEAQFGDFANGAQTIFDQFISSSESKWQRMTGLVMLLPHGYEGQGPEHSSARLERYLQACAEYNIFVTNITEPANFFHALRRQLALPFRKPLVVMSPKSLLRYPKCISDISELSEGGFKEILEDNNTVAAAKVRRVLVCSGKIYYDLIEEKNENKHKDVAIVRLEQLYPLPVKQLDDLVKRYKNAEWVWVQEEPENMGAWTFILSRYRKVDWRVISRKYSASTATGFKKIHIEEQARIVAKAFE